MDEGEGHELGEPAGVSSCRSRTALRCRAQDAGLSTLPNMIVAVVLRPSPCAVRITDSHSLTVTLSGQRIFRIGGSRISAAVPGRDPSPASTSLSRNASTGRPSVAAPWLISSGEKAWTCMSGAAAFTARAIET